MSSRQGGERRLGVPLDPAVIGTDALAFSMRCRIEPDDAECQEISAQWSKALRSAFDSLPEVLAGEPRRRERSPRALFRRS